MLWKVKKSRLSGAIKVPPSKSHTIRSILIATLADGESVIEDALVDGDGRSAIEAAIHIGAKCRCHGDTIRISGIGGDLSRGVETLFMGNSGTSTRLFTAAVALGDKPRTFDGDDSLRTRKMAALLQALSDLGATYSIHQTGRDIPFTIQGPIHAGEATVSGITSQFISSLLLTAPLLPGESVFHVVDLHEKPYVEITLWWLDKQGIRYHVSRDFSTFRIGGSQKYKPFTTRIPGDFSSATFGAVGAALTRGMVALENLDFQDPQGDKEVLTLLEHMGVIIQRDAGSVTVTSEGGISGRVLDLNAMPDALPAFSVLGCVAEGQTHIVNVEQARIKETDRIQVMAKELMKMGARIEERKDGLVISKSSLKGCRVSGHYDHRVVMALALAGMVATGETVIETAETAAVTYPSFAADFKNLGADIQVIQ